MNAADRNESAPDLHPGSGVSVSDTARERRWRDHRPAAIFFALLPVLLFGLIALVDFPLCPFRVLVGVDCPGCGLTRATDAMLHLHLGEMLRLHPLAPIFAPLVFVTLARITAHTLGHELPKLPFRIPNAVWLALIVGLLGLWVARLAGFLGGTPDPIDFSSGLLGRAWSLLAGA